MLIDNFAKLNRSSRRAVSAALIVIAAIALYNWFVAPHADCLFAAQQYLSVTDNIAKKNKDISNTVKIKRDRLQELLQQLAQFQSTLFTPKQAKEFFSDLQVISEQAGCTVNSLNLMVDNKSSEDSPFKDITEIRTNSAILSVVATYGDIIELIQRLQDRDQKVWVKSIEMENFESDPTHTLLGCDMNITIYTVQNMEAVLND